MAKARSATKGVITGPQLASMFAWMRPNDLIWNYWVNNYLLGNKPPAFDILAWNADTTRLPGQFHSDLLDLVADNPYVNPGRLEIDEVPIDMTKVKVGAYVVGGITDHITPWNGCYGTARLFGEESTFVLANAGHLQSLLESARNSKVLLLLGARERGRPARMGEACATNAPGRQLVAALARMDPAEIWRTGSRAQAGGFAQASSACSGTWRVRATTVTVRDINRIWYSAEQG